jgi:hypothetical protein
VIYQPDHPIVDRVALQFQLDPELLSAQIFVESSGDPFAFRFEPAYFDRYVRDRPLVAGFKYGPLAACSFGLLQILLETAIEHGFEDQPQRLFDPMIGMTFGAKYLRHCLDLTGQDYRKALAKYNGSGTAAMAYATKVFSVRDRAASNDLRNV